MRARTWRPHKAAAPARTQRLGRAGRSRDRRPQPPRISESRSAREPSEAQVWLDALLPATIDSGLRLRPSTGPVRRRPAGVQGTCRWPYDGGLIKPPPPPPLSQRRAWCERGASDCEPAPTARRTLPGPAGGLGRTDASSAHLAGSRSEGCAPASKTAQRETCTACAWVTAAAVRPGEREGAEE